MSSRMIRLSAPNSASASAGPRVADPGRPEEQEAAHQRVAEPGPGTHRHLATAATSSCLPHDPLVRPCSSPRSRSFSSSVSWRTGMPVARDTTSAMSLTSPPAPRSRPARPGDLLLHSGDLVAQLEARSYCSLATAWSLSRCSSSARRSSSRASAGGLGAQPGPTRRPGRSGRWPCRQEPVGDVPVGQLDAATSASSVYPDLVVRLVAVPQPAQDDDRVVGVGSGTRIGWNGLGQRRVLLDVLAVLIQGVILDDVQLTAGQGKLGRFPSIPPSPPLTRHPRRYAARR